MAKYECNSHMENFLRELPKCEHHLHLEGTLEPALLYKLAKRNNIILPDEFPKSVEECNLRYDNFSDLQDFLNHYYIGMSVLITEDDFYDLAMEYFHKAKSDGCLHSEVFFDPQGHLERGIEMDLVVNGFNRACKEANEKLGTSNKLIMCLLRHLSNEDGMKTIHLASDHFQNDIIHGLGLDSAELPNPPELFKQCYQHMIDNHPEVRLTAHAGEEGDHSYVSDSLDHLNVTRIDHGVNSIQNHDLMSRLVNEQVMLTLCPLSNVKLQVVKDVGELPIDEFFNRGVHFSINSDDPAYFGGYILDNYKLVHTRFGFSFDQWKSVAINSIKGSWCDNNRKEELLNLVDEIYVKYTGKHL